jgi:hypothetical protein
MTLEEILREEPYNNLSDIEYYDRGYRRILGIPGRVLQGKEITSLSSYPLYILKDLTELYYHNMDILDGIKNISMPKLLYNNDSLIEIDDDDLEIVDDDILIDIQQKLDKLEEDVGFLYINYNNLSSYIPIIENKYLVLVDKFDEFKLPLYNDRLYIYK